MQIEDLKKLPEEMQVEAYRMALRNRYKESLYITAKHLLGYKDMNHHTHMDMILALENPTKRKLIVMPRGTFKSSIAVVAYSIWLLMKDPNHRILIDSEVYTNSKNFLREIKHHVQDGKFVDIFGEWRTDNNWTENEITIRPRTKSFKEASITCGGIGTVKVGQHYTIIIGDDYNSGNNSETPEMRKKVINHYKMNTSILEPSGTMVIIGTRYATDDVIGHILSNEVIGDVRNEIKT